MITFPQNTQCGVEDFHRSGWKEIIRGAERQNSWNMKTALSAAASKAIEEGRVAEGKVLWLLAEACSMALKPCSLNRPFEPSIVLLDRRSTILEDFTAEDLAFFKSIVEDIDDQWLRARIADVVWVLLRPRDPKYALMAIDAYHAIPLSMETFLAGRIACWDRAVCLAKMLRAGAGDRLQKLAGDLYRGFESAIIKDGVFCLKILEIIERHGLGMYREQDIAGKLESMAKEAEAEKEPTLARMYFDAASTWYLKAKDEVKAAELVVCSAETYVQEAHARLASDHPSYMVAASFYEDALQKLRHIPRAQRKALRVDERFAEIYAKMTEVGEKSVNEMRPIATEAVDLSEIVSDSMEAVRGKELLEAFTNFVNIHPGISKKKAQEAAKEMHKVGFLQSLFAGVQMSRDGRVIGKTTASSSVNSEDDRLWADMVKQHGLELRFVVHGCIWPALEVLRLEHRLTEETFVNLAANSPIVPPGRANLFGKALYAGYDNDFVTALHLLVPQIENLIRWHLKSRGVKTTTIDTNGINTENGLSTLADLQEVEKIFGEDFIFELKALFCDCYGPNLRNEVAHGLLNSDECQSEYSLYAWWFGLGIIFRTFLYRKREAEAQKPPKPGKRLPKKPHPRKVNRSRKRWLL